MNTCRSCMAPILWACSVKGFRIPLDPEPVDDGNVYIDGTAITNAGEKLPAAFIATQAHPAPDGAERFKSHFATCPDATSHRRNR